MRSPAERNIDVLLHRTLTDRIMDNLPLPDRIRLDDEIEAQWWRRDRLQDALNWRRRLQWNERVKYRGEARP